MVLAISYLKGAKIASPNNYIFLFQSTEWFLWKDTQQILWFITYSSNFFNYTLKYLASKCLVKEVLVVAIKTVCKRVFSSTSLNVLWSSVTRGSFENSMREMLVDFRLKHLSSKYPSSIDVSPKLCDNSRLTCKVSGLKRRNPATSSMRRKLTTGQLPSKWWHFRRMQYVQIDF